MREVADSFYRVPCCLSVIIHRAESTDRDASEVPELSVYQQQQRHGNVFENVAPPARRNFTSTDDLTNSSS